MCKCNKDYKLTTANVCFSVIKGTQVICICAWSINVWRKTSFRVQLGPTFTYCTLITLNTQKMVAKQIICAYETKTKCDHYNIKGCHVGLRPETGQHNSFAKKVKSL